MIESVSLDQLRMFVAAADAGSFSAAARRLNRAQSAISQAIAALEGSLGITLFDRTERLPKITAEGHKLLSTARSIVRDTDGLKAHARNLAGGLEPEVAIVLDTMVPQDLSREWLFDLPLVIVVAPSHPLAAINGVIKPEVAERHVQIVLTDRSTLSTGQNFGVVSRHPWRVTELSTKHAFLCAGLGWGHMPYPSVAEDIDAGRLVAIELEGVPIGYKLSMSAVYRSDSQPGLAGRWMIDRLKSSGAETINPTVALAGR